VTTTRALAIRARTRAVRGVRDTQSLGDQSTFGGAGGDDEPLDDGMEVVDLSRYDVQETLGKGGMGEVLLAMDTCLERKVAIKRMLGDGAKSRTAVKVADVIEKAHSLREECRFEAASNATLQVVCR
jgi:hypothetical protein